MRLVLALLAVAALALAAVYVSEGGDVVYYSTLGGFGALNGLGQRLWHVDAPGALIATDPMGSCLAVGRPLTNGTHWLGFLVALYVRGTPLWGVTLNFNATAVATDCRRVAVADAAGNIVELENGKTVSTQKVGVPVISLLYDNGTLKYGTWFPGRLEYRLRCNYTVVVEKRDRPYVIVDGVRYIGVGEMLTLTPPAAVSQNCILAFAAEGAVYWGSRAISVKESVYAVGISGDGSVLALGFADRVEIYRGRVLVASIPASMPRSLALDFRGFTLAVQDDRGVSVYSFTAVEVEVRGCPYGLLQAGQALFNVTGRSVVYVPRGAEVKPLTVNFTDGVCAPAGFDGRVVSYQRLYRVEVTPPAKGPELAAGPTAYAAPLEAKVRAKTGVLKAYLAGWLVGGRRMPPVPVLTVDVRNATAVAPLYRLDVAAELVEGGVKRVLKGVAAYDSKGAPMAPVEDYVYPGLPAYVETYYDKYYLLRAEAYTRSTFNATELWLKPGQTAVIYADGVVDFGNSTRLVFTGWSDGSKELRRAVGPGTYTARYKVQYLVTFNAPNYTAAVWADAGAKPPAPKPPEKLYDDGSTRIWFNGWQLPERVDGPLNVTANTAREYRVVLKYPWGQEERWLPHGYALLPPDRDRYNVFWKFAYWSPSDVVAGPGVYEAVYQLDTFAVAAVASVAVVAVAAALWFKRR